MSEGALRPRDLALLLLAGGDLRPRARARDQQADRAGLALKRQVLESIAALDPEPEDLEGTLARLVEQHGPPTGPTRAVALSLLEDWQAAVLSPEWLAHLLGEAVNQQARDQHRGGQHPA